MKRGRRTLLRLERRPWILAAFAGLGATMLIPSALALYGPPELLDSAIALGDARLRLGLAAFYVASVGIFRVALRRRRLPEESVDDEPLPVPPAAHDEMPAAPARAHLR